MNIRSVGITFSTVLMAAALLAGCYKQPAQRAGDPATPAAIQPGISVGPLHSGMTIRQATAMLGQPDWTNDVELVYTNLGIHVLPGNGDSVHIVGVCAPFAGRTKEGLGIGDRRATVIQVYGQPTGAMPLKPGYDVIKYKSLGLNFEFYDNKVNMIATVFSGQ